MRYLGTKDEVEDLATQGDGTGGGVTDHGMLLGLADDDHPQYHTDARGDIRYYTKAQADALLADKADVDPYGRVHLRCSNGATLTWGTGGSPVIGWTSVENTAGFTVASGVWTVPYAGLYAIEAALTAQGTSTANVAFRLDLLVNSVGAEYRMVPVTGRYASNSIATKRSLSAGDTIGFVATGLGEALTKAVASEWNSLTITRLGD